MREGRSVGPWGRAELAVALAGLGLFALLAALVQARVLVEFDAAAGRWVRGLEWAPLDVWSAAASIAVAAELSLLYALMASALLWRAGLGWWSAAPLAFLLPMAVEFALKFLLFQAAPPMELQPRVPYPLISVQTPGAFPSGHATRSAYLGVFAAVLLWSRGSIAARLGSLGCLLLALLLGFSRVYLGQHWLSDVLGGLLLGGAAALLAAGPVARRVVLRP